MYQSHVGKVKPKQKNINNEKQQHQEQQQQQHHRQEQHTNKHIPKLTNVFVYSAMHKMITTSHESILFTRSETNFSFSLNDDVQLCDFVDFHIFSLCTAAVVAFHFCRMIKRIAKKKKTEKKQTTKFSSACYWCVSHIYSIQIAQMTSSREIDMCSISVVGHPAHSFWSRLLCMCMFRRVCVCAVCVHQLIGFSSFHQWSDIANCKNLYADF